MKAILRSINNFSCKLKQSNNLKYNVSPKIRSNKFKNISGNGNVTIEDAIKRNLKDYKIYGNTVQSKLPSGYTQVDYIESDGNQYINTGVNADSNLSVKMNFSSNYHIQQRHMGAIKNDNGVYTRHHITINGSSAVNYLISYSGQTNSAQNLLSTIDDNKHYLNLDIYNKKVSVDEETPIDLTLQPFDTELNYWLFARNSNNSTNMSFAIMKIYDCKMYYSDVLVRDFIPCYRNSDNEVGLYDLVNNVFYTNQGTGSFTYGNMAPTPDAPIEMVSCGDRTKNLFDKNNANIINGYIQGNTGKIILGNSDLIAYIKCKPNTQYSFQRMQIRDNKGRLRIGTTQTIPIADMAVENFYYKGNSEYSTNKLDGYTTGANAEYLLFYFSQISGMSQNEIDTILSSIQIEENSIATSHEPYGYKIPVNVRSDNLFKVIAKSSNGITSVINSDGSITYSGTATSTWANITANNYIDIEPGEYTFSIDKPLDYKIIIRLYYEDDTFAYAEIYAGNTKRSFTLNRKVKRYYAYIANYLTVGKEYNETLYIQLVKGPTAPSKYIPYYNETTNIYLDEPLRKIDGYSDYIDFINGKVVRNIDEIVLAGSEDWAKSSMADVNRYFVGVTSNPLIHTIKNKYTIDLISDYFKCIAPAISDNGGIGLAKYNATGFLLNFELSNTNFDTLSKFLNWLSTHNTTVYYVLATPTEEDIELPNINLIEGKNIITIGTDVQGVFETEYYSKEIIDISNYKYNLRKVED